MTLDLKTITHDLRAQLPHLLALYLFGSAASGDAAAHSDVDLAVLVDGKVDTLRRNLLHDIKQTGSVYG